MGLGMDLMEASLPNVFVAAKGMCSEWMNLEHIFIAV